MNGPRLTIDASRFRRRLQRQVRSLKGGKARRALRAAARQDVLPSVEKESPVVTGAMRGSWIVRNVNPASLPKGVYALCPHFDGRVSLKPAPHLEAVSGYLCSMSFVLCVQWHG